MAEQVRDGFPIVSPPDGLGQDHGDVDHLGSKRTQVSAAEGAIPNRHSQKAESGTSCWEWGREAAGTALKGGRKTDRQIPERLC